MNPPIINQKAIPIINQPTDHHNLTPTDHLKYSIDHSIFQSISIDHSGSIDRGGFNRLKPPVKTPPGFDRPTLSIVVFFHIIYFNAL